jgi:plastocyanin
MRILVVLALATVSSVASAQSVPVTRAGKVTFRVKNEGSVTHGLYVRGDGVAEGSHEIPAGQAGSLTVTLKPGTYEIYCPMADLSHKNAGMAAKLEVTAGDKPADQKKPPT